MTQPPGDDADRGLGADVSQVSDQDWLAGHRALLGLGVFPDAELAYLYDPERAPETVTPADLTPYRDPAEPEVSGG